MRHSNVRAPMAWVLVTAGALQFVAATVVQAQTKRQPTPDDFAELNEVDDVRISPNGAWVAAVIRVAPNPRDSTVRSGRGVFVVPSDGSAAPRRVGHELGVSDFVRWAPDGHTLALLAAGAGGGRQVFLYAVDEPARAVRVLDSAPVGVSALEWAPSGRELALLAPVRGPDGRTATGLWLLDLTSGDARPITPAGVNVRDLAWSPRGDALALITAGGAGGASIRVVDRSGQIRTIAENAGSPGTRRQVLDFSPDGRTVLFARGTPDGEVGQWLGLAPVDGGPVRELLRDYEGTVMRAQWAPDGRGILAQSFEGLLSRLLRVDARTDEITRIADIMDAYPTFTVAADGRTFAYRGDRLDGPADIWVLPAGTTARRITHLNPRFDEVAVASAREFTWTNPEDGMQLQGVLVLPPDHRPERAYPTIVQLHGGPHFHWGLGWYGTWHHWAQLLATRGYVVFLPNPRGSTGRGTSFASAIIHDVGGIDFRDVMTGVDALVAAGIADADRLGVGGWSYGGFLTARTITQTDRFKAAVVGAGISNLFSFAGTPGLGRGWARSFFPDHPYAARAAFEERSATTHLANVRSPTLVVHGERDAKISVTQAWELHYGLQYLGIDTDILIFPRAGHGLTDPQDRVAYQTGVLHWFDRYVRAGETRTRVTSEAGTR